MPSGVYNHYKIKGKSFRKFKDMKLNFKKIIKQYLAGKYINKLTEEYKINKTQLYLILKKHKIMRSKTIYTKRQQINSIHLTKEERAYIAGLFDGEGCLHKEKRFWSMCIANTNKKVMNWLIRKINNGGIYKKQKLFDNTIHTYYVWQTSKQNAIYELLLLIHPYCIIKNKIIDLFLKKGEYNEKIN